MRMSGKHAALAILATCTLASVAASAVTFRRPIERVASMDQLRAASVCDAAVRPSG